MKYSPFSPVEIHICKRQDALTHIEHLITDTQLLVVFAGTAMLERLNLLNWLKILQEDVPCLHISHIPNNPTILDIERNLLALNGRCPEHILAIGGGSCIDMAKAISAFSHKQRDGVVSSSLIRKLLKNKDYVSSATPADIIAVPTTAGTGSEVTKWATIWDMGEMEKHSIESVEIFPKAAFIVPEFTMHMSSSLTLSTGLDALCHAMEAFWARNRTPLSQALAVSALSEIRCNIADVLENPTIISSREGMCKGSLLAGLAFSITRTTACHSISYPLTMRYGIPHGFAAATTLAAVAEKNSTAVVEIHDFLQPFGGIQGFSVWIKNISDPIQPLTLSKFGVNAKDIPHIAINSFTQGRMDNNPVAFTMKDIELLLLNAM